ncbi:MAG: AAA family ATPase [Oscillospiraceae bacterium]|jgi:DNA polymerase-3 subunit gamma/tau|nr:AAA family ATPase [Oscillospiraceae bacterium]
MAEEKLAFHRKYRPSTVVGYIGNEKMKKGAMAVLDKGERPQSWLLTGSSGCGKTTFARLLAKEFMCENRKPFKGACGECEMCRQADYFIKTGDTKQQAFIKEIDIADQSGKKDINGVLDEMQVPTFMGQWRVYIFDECHMATEGAQNRVLKVVEEPPENVLLIFCTTDPERMILTLRNRCTMQLEVKKPTVGELSGLLQSVCDEENVDFDLKGLNFIAGRGNFVIRSALTGLERVVNEKGNAKYESVVDVFEGVNDKLIIDFYKKLLRSDKDIMEYVVHLHKIKTGVGIENFRTELLEFTKKGIYTINSIKTDGMTEGELKMFKGLFGNFSVTELGIIMQKLMSLNGDIEAKLLLWGYEGLLGTSVENTQNKESLKVLENGEEKGLEKAQRNKIIAEKREVLEENSTVLAEEQMGEATMDDVLNLFGAAEVK